MISKERWPNFFIVGAPRAGTTSLYEYLHQHPKIFMSTKKEPSYFLKEIPKIIYPIHVRGKKEYLKLFKNVKNEKAVGEASTGYLVDPESPKLIYKQVPNAKIIIILRDPIERSYSHYHMLIRMNHEKGSFSEVIRRDANRIERGLVVGNTIKSSFYYQPIKEYFETFGNENVKILVFEEFVNDVLGTVKEVLKFLDLGDELHEFKIEKFNVFRIPKGKIEKLIVDNITLRKIVYRLMGKHQIMKLGKEILYKKNISKHPILPDDKEFLEKLFFNDSYKTQKILGRDLPWPLLKK